MAQIAAQLKSDPNLKELIDTPLKNVIEAWQDLPEAIRAGILAMVEASKE